MRVVGGRSVGAYGAEFVAIVFSPGGDTAVRRELGRGGAVAVEPGAAGGGGLRGIGDIDGVGFLSGYGDVAGWGGRGVGSCVAVGIAEGRSSNFAIHGDCDVWNGAGCDGG